MKNVINNNRKFICNNLSKKFIKLWKDFRTTSPHFIIRAIISLIVVIVSIIALISINRVGINDIHVYTDVYSKDSVCMNLYIDCGEQNTFNVLKKTDSISTIVDIFRFEETPYKNIYNRNNNYYKNVIINDSSKIVVKPEIVKEYINKEYHDTIDSIIKHNGEQYFEYVKFLAILNNVGNSNKFIYHDHRDELPSNIDEVYRKYKFIYTQNQSIINDSIAKQYFERGRLFTRYKNNKSNYIDYQCLLLSNATGIWKGGVRPDFYVEMDNNLLKNIFKNEDIGKTLYRVYTDSKTINNFDIHFYFKGATLVQNNPSKKMEILNLHEVVLHNSNIGDYNNSDFYVENPELENLQFVRNFFITSIIAWLSTVFIKNLWTAIKYLIDERIRKIEQKK